MRIFIPRTFKPWELALIKICSISLGILLGLYFTPFLASFLWLWWVLFVATASYFIGRFVSGK